MVIIPKQYYLPLKVRKTVTTWHLASSNYSSTTTKTSNELRIKLSTLYWSTTTEYATGYNIILHKYLQVFRGSWYNISTICTFFALSWDIRHISNFYSISIFHAGLHHYFHRPAFVSTSGMKKVLVNQHDTAREKWSGKDVPVQGYRIHACTRFLPKPKPKSKRIITCIKLFTYLHLYPAIIVKSAWFRVSSLYDLK